MIQSRNEGAIMFTTFSQLKGYGNFFFVSQGQVTPKRIVQSGPKTNLSEILCLSFLPASLMKIKYKMKALSCSQHFFHYMCKSMGKMFVTQGQVTPK